MHRARQLLATPAGESHIQGADGRLPVTGSGRSSIPTDATDTLQRAHLEPSCAGALQSFLRVAIGIDAGGSQGRDRHVTAREWSGAKYVDSLISTESAKTLTLRSSNDLPTR